MTAYDPTDDSLVLRIRAGSEEAWGHLFRKHRDRIYRFAIHMSGSMEIAEEVAQETFIAFLDQLDRYDGARGSVATYLIGIARNKVLRHVRDRGWEIPMTDAGMDLDSGINPLRDLTREQACEQVRRAVLALPPAYRETIVLCELEEASYEEAAAVLACPVGTVRSRLHRARRMLLERLAAEGKGCLHEM